MKFQSVGKLALISSTLSLIGFARYSHGEPPPTKSDDSEDRIFKDIYPFLKKYCTSCHNDVSPHAQRSLTDYQDEKSILKDREIWFDIVKLVSNNSMPPANHAKQPSAKETDRFTRLINELLGKESRKEK